MSEPQIVPFPTTASEPEAPGIASRAVHGTERERIRGEREGWLSEDAKSVAERYRSGELDVLDLVRQYGVIVDWGTGELLPRTSEMFRAMLRRRAVAHWGAPSAA